MVYEGQQNNEGRETNTVKIWTFIYAQWEDFIFKFLNTKSMFKLNSAAFFITAFKVKR